MVLATAQPLVSFPAFLPEEDELWQYSDSAMHELCFEGWANRDLMLQKYGRAVGEISDQDQLHPTRIAIIGTPDDRTELLRRLQEGG